MLNLGAGRKSRLRGVCLYVLSMTTRHVKRRDWLLQPREQLCTMVQSKLCQEKERDRQTGQETSRVEVGSPFKKGTLRLARAILAVQRLQSLAS